MAQYSMRFLITLQSLQGAALWAEQQARQGAPLGEWYPQLSSAFYDVLVAVIEHEEEVERDGNGNGTAESNRPATQ